MKPLDESNPEKVAVVGGGLAGMFTALALLRLSPKKKVYLIETTGRLGGRIRTVRIRRRSKSHEDGMTSRIVKIDNSISVSPNHGASEGQPEDLDLFHAEFGPMRVELQLQRLIELLMRSCNISTDSKKPCDRLEDFPPFSSPDSAHDPKYDLPPSERDRKPLELLELAILRVLMHLDLCIPEEEYKNAKVDYQEPAKMVTKWLEKFRNEVKSAASVGIDPIPYFRRKVQELGKQPKAIWLIQKYGGVRDPSSQTPEKPIPLYMVGFWNLLSGFLSHDGILKLQTMGTFYHLFPENPNAAEWLTWWLENLAITDHLQGLAGGMELLVRHLHDRLESYRKKERLVIVPQFKVKSLCELGDGIALVGRVRAPGSTKEEVYLADVAENGNLSENFLFEPLKASDTKSDKSNTEPDQKVHRFSRLFLALPKDSLTKIIRLSQERHRIFAKQTAIELDKSLKAAFAFPLIKIFCLVRRRWWHEKIRSNLGATRMPTRELYAWSPRSDGPDPSDRESSEGLLMIYTDRPATSFWNNYVRGDVDHEDFESTAEDRQGSENEKEVGTELWSRLKRKICRYINANEEVNLTEDDILWIGIRDWGRGPFGGANHAWRPKRRYWIAMNSLGGFATCKEIFIHACGEAYSDYHGFMEGALRSSMFALSRAYPESFENEEVSIATFQKIFFPTSEPKEFAPDKGYEEKKDQEFFKYMHWWMKDVATWEAMSNDKDYSDGKRDNLYYSNRSKLANLGAEDETIPKEGAAGPISSPATRSAPTKP